MSKIWYATTTIGWKDWEIDAVRTTGGRGSTSLRFNCGQNGLYVPQDEGVIAATKKELLRSTSVAALCYRSAVAIGQVTLDRRALASVLTALGNGTPVPYVPVRWVVLLEKK